MKYLLLNESRYCFILSGDIVSRNMELIFIEYRTKMIFHKE